MQNAAQYKRVVTETELLDIVVDSFKRVLVVTKLGRTRCFF